MFFNTPLAREIASTALEPAEDVPPPNARAAWTVLRFNARGNAALAARLDNATATKPADGATPRRVSRARNRCRAHANRDKTVPLGQPIIRAASSLVRPSR